jgi:hypothetical protein
MFLEVLGMPSSILCVLRQFFRRFFGTGVFFFIPFIIFSRPPPFVTGS